MYGGAKRCGVRVPLKQTGETKMTVPAQGPMFLGAYRMALSLKDCAILVHGPCGCHVGPTFFETLTNNLSSNATVSVMKERSMVYGGIANLEKAIGLTRKYCKNKRIIVLSSHVPSIIGDDLEFVEADIHRDCGGIQPMWQGMETFLSSYNEFIEAIKDQDITVLFGTDEERRIRTNTIVFAFPSFTRMSYVPYLAKGTLNVISDIYGRLMGWI